MNLKSDFTRLELERFRRDCGFTAEEMAVFNIRTDGKEHSLISIAHELNMSTSTVSRRIRNIKQKIIRVL